MAPMNGRVSFRPDEKRKVVEVVGDMDAEFQAGREDSRPTPYSVVSRLHGMRNHPISRRKRAYLEPLVEVVLEEQRAKKAAEAAAESTEKTASDDKTDETEKAETLAEVERSEEGPRPEVKEDDGDREQPARPTRNDGRLRKRKRLRSEDEDEETRRRRLRRRKERREGEDDEEEEEADGSYGGGGEEGQGTRKKVAPTPILANGPRIGDISGMDGVLEKLLYDVWVPLRRGHYYGRGSGGPGSRGSRGKGFNQPVLLYGPSGCGKTLLAHALAAEAGVHFFAVSGPDIIGGVSGESEANIRNIFESAMAMAPSLVFLDDLETIAGKLQQDGAGSASAAAKMESRIAATLNHCIDRLEWSESGSTADGGDDNTDNAQLKNVVVLAATNNANNVNPLVRRRFDVEIAVTVPNEAARLAILQTMARDLPLADDVDLAEIARLTPGFVGGDLKNVVKTASRLHVEHLIVAELAELRRQARAEPDQPRGICADFALLCEAAATQPPEQEQQQQPPPIGAESFREAAGRVVPAAKREGFSTIPDTTWAQVGAMKMVRKKLEMSIIGPIRYPEKYAGVGLAPGTGGVGGGGGGILLWGPPGCGKTLVAKAVANESKANFISIRGPELLNKYVGESERALRELFERARAMRPCVIFFDEMDALAAKRDDARSDGSARIVNTLLTELDGLVDRSGIYVIGATNRPDIIDPALKRPGRLGESIFVGPPTAEDRVSILQTLYANALGGQRREENGEKEENEEKEKDKKDGQAATMTQLAAVARDRRCTGFSGADLAHLLRAAGMHSLERTMEDSDAEAGIVAADWEAALAETRPSTSPAELERYERLQ